MNNYAFSKILVLVILLTLAGGGFFAWQYFGAPEEKVKDETADWQIYRNEEHGFEFKYPNDFNYQYIKTHIWPPKVAVSSIDSNFVCEEFQKEGPLVAQKEITINNSKYCALTTVEGAAGSIYFDYKYITNKDGRQLTVEFVLVASNCGVFYGVDNKMEDCEKERESFNKDFNPNELLDRALSTFKFLE